MTRREITENRIIQNILLNNDPKELQVYEDIFISTRSASSEALLAMGPQAAVFHINALKNVAAGIMPDQQMLVNFHQPGILHNMGHQTMTKNKKKIASLYQNSTSLPKIKVGASRNVTSMV